MILANWEPPRSSAWPGDPATLRERDARRFRIPLGGYVVEPRESHTVSCEFCRVTVVVMGNGWRVCAVALLLGCGSVLETTKEDSGIADDAGVDAVADAVDAPQLPVPHTMRVASGAYTGNGVDDRLITGAGFKPDVVLVKRSFAGEGSVWRTSTMVGDTSAVATCFNCGPPVASNLVQSLDADGFTIGSAVEVNSSGGTYFWVAMTTGTNLAIGTYVGNGVDNRNITGVGFQPEWLVTLGTTTLNSQSFRGASMAGDHAYERLDSSTLATNTLQALQADGFQLGSSSAANSNGETFHYIAWDATANVVQTSQVGDSADPRTVTLGFQPTMVWFKRDNASVSTFGTLAMFNTLGDFSQRFVGVGSANNIQAFLSNGFQIGGGVEVNLNTVTYHYLAF